MNVPKWDELTDSDRGQLQRIASSFGISMNGHKVDDMVLPNETEAFSIAFEMYSLSKAIIERNTNHG